jgi:hypothetical protein
MALDLDFGGSNIAAHATAIEKLLDHQHEGMKVVARVGLGFKLAGQTVKTPVEWAYRVYVKWQKTAVNPVAASNAAFDSIPATVDGVKTDVFFEVTTLDFACQSELVPGMKLTPCKQGSEEEQGFGTIGLVLQKGADRFLLTDGHVLLKVMGGGDPDVVDVYVPDRKSSASTRPIVATSVLAKLVNTRKRITDGEDCFVDIDAGLAKIAPEMEFSSTPVDIGGPVQAALRDLVPEAQPSPPNMISVWKYGARTELTKGVVVELVHVLQNRNTFWMARVQPTEGWTAERRFYVQKRGASAASIDELITRFRNRCTTVARDGETANAYVISVAGPSFSWQGDSGAAVFDASGQVIGLVKGGEGYQLFDTGEEDAAIPTAQLVMAEPSAVSYIAPAFAELGLAAADIVAASGTTSGDAIAVPGAPMVRRRRISDSEIARVLARSPAGRLVASLYERHARELVRLVHHHRRVTVAWHRGKAAGFMTALLAVLDGTRSTLPLALDGITAGPALRTLFSALHHEAGTGLRVDLERHGEWIATLVDQVSSTDDVAKRLARARIAE